jgi:hypothetical protein
MWHVGLPCSLLSLRGEATSRRTYRIERRNPRSSMGTSTGARAAPPARTPRSRRAAREAPATPRRTPGATSECRGPRLQLGRTQRLHELGPSLPVEVRCDEGCTVRAQLPIKRATARKLSIRSRTLASGSARPGAAGTTYVFMRFKRATVHRLAPARTVRAELGVSGSNVSGNRRAEDRALRLRR